MQLKECLDEELKLIWKIQIRAFNEDLLKYSNLSPGAESFEEFYKKREKFIINKICFEKK